MSRYRATYNKVSDLIPQDGIGDTPRGTNGFNLCLLVEQFQIVVDQDRVDGTRLVLAEAMVGDETASIQIRVQESNVGVLQSAAESNGAVVLRNVSLELHKGRHLCLIISKFGKLTRYPDAIESTPKPPTFINKTRNLSEMDMNTRFKPPLPSFSIAYRRSISRHTIKPQPPTNDPKLFLFQSVIPSDVETSYSPYAMIDETRVLYNYDHSPSPWTYHPLQYSSTWYDESNLH